MNKMADIVTLRRIDVNGDALTSPSHIGWSSNLLLSNIIDFPKYQDLKILYRVQGTTLFQEYTVPSQAVGAYLLFREGAIDVAAQISIMPYVPYDVKVKFVRSNGDSIESELNTVIYTPAVHANLAAIKPNTPSGFKLQLSRLSAAVTKAVVTRPTNSAVNVLATSFVNDPSFTNIPFSMPAGYDKYSAATVQVSLEVNTPYNGVVTTPATTLYVPPSPVFSAGLKPAVLSNTKIRVFWSTGNLGGASTMYIGRNVGFYTALVGTAVASAGSFDVDVSEFGYTVTDFTLSDPLVLMFATNTSSGSSSDFETLTFTGILSASTLDTAQSTATTIASYATAKEAAQDALSTIKVLTTAAARATAKANVIEALKTRPDVTTDANGGRTFSYASSDSAGIQNFVNSLRKVAGTFPANKGLDVVIPDLTKGTVPRYDIRSFNGNYVNFMLNKDQSVELTEGITVKLLTYKDDTDAGDPYFLVDSVRTEVGSDVLFTGYKLTLFAAGGATFSDPTIVNLNPGGTTGGTTGGAVGDPYVTTVDGTFYKLPVFEGSIRYYQGIVDGKQLTINATLKAVSADSMQTDMLRNMLASKHKLTASNQSRAAMAWSQATDATFFEKVYVQYGDNAHAQFDLFDGKIRVESLQGFSASSLQNAHVGPSPAAGELYAALPAFNVTLPIGSSAKLTLSVFAAANVRNAIHLESPAMSEGNGVVVHRLSREGMSLPSITSTQPVPRQSCEPARYATETFYTQGQRTSRRIALVK